MIPDAGSPPPSAIRRIRNPGRRGLSAELYGFVPRFPLEAIFRHDVEYRKLRWAFDAATASLHRLAKRGVSDIRLRTYQQRITDTAKLCAEYMLQHVPETSERVATELVRTFSADGELEHEERTETPLETFTDA